MAKSNAQRQAEFKARQKAKGPEYNRKHAEEERRRRWQNKQLQGAAMLLQSHAKDLESGVQSRTMAGNLLGANPAPAVTEKQPTAEPEAEPEPDSHEQYEEEYTDEEVDEQNFGLNNDWVLVLLSSFP